MTTNENNTETFSGRFLSGWGKIFGKKQVQKDKETPISNEESKEKKKPFPPNDFFNQEYLRFLNDNPEQCNTPLRRWALQMSLWAKSKCKAQNIANDYFPNVRWHDGLLSTFIDMEYVCDDIDKQAERLYQLQLEGYELEETFVRMIDARACRLLKNCLFEKIAKQERNQENNPTNHQTKNSSFIEVQEVIDQAGKELSLLIHHYKTISHENYTIETIEYKQFKVQLENKEILALSEEEQFEWHKIAEERDNAKELFRSLVSVAKRNNIYQGMFPAYTPLRLYLNNVTDLVPTSWFLSGKEIRITIEPKEGVSESSLTFSIEDAYQVVDFLNYINQSISQQNPYHQDILTFVRAFGKDFCNEKILSSGDKSFCQINGIEINRVTAKVSDEIIAFNSATLEIATLSSKNKEQLFYGILLYANAVLTALIKKQENVQNIFDKEMTQEKLRKINNVLSVYDADRKATSIESLWTQILSLFNIEKEAIQPKSQNPQEEDKNIKATAEPLKTEDEKPISLTEESLPQQIQEATADVETTEQRKEERANVTIAAEATLNEATTKEAESPLEGYIKITPMPKGRWHTAAMECRYAYQLYGKLLSDKIKKQLDNSSNPWVSKVMIAPRDISGNLYAGSNALMLALWAEEQGFELPFFITENELIENNLSIHQEAKRFFILNNEGAESVYNIEQTSFPMEQKRAYESLKMNMIAAERKKTHGYQFLDSEEFCKPTLVFDGTPGLSAYNYTEKKIHIAPKERFESEDDYYRDLAIAMVESTREVDFDQLRMDRYLFENLVSHLGSGIISQSCRFDATNPEYSKLWRERLESNPDYVREILEHSVKSSDEVLQSSLS